MKEAYKCWLRYEELQANAAVKYRRQLQEIVVSGKSLVLQTAVKELSEGIDKLLAIKPQINHEPRSNHFISVGTLDHFKADLNSEETAKLEQEGFLIKLVNSDDTKNLIITGLTDGGVLYGVFALLQIIQVNGCIERINLLSNPVNPIRMINHWDNLDGSVERGYAGRSIFYKDNQLTSNLSRVKDYARLLASIGINAIAVNNVNVHNEETRLITDKLDMVIRLAEIFREYGIKVFVSINFASPLSLGELDTADPCDGRVVEWWQKTADRIYQAIPDFGGFLVKADSENRPGPFNYNRDHTDGANMLAKALEPYGGLLFWRCFVYNCQQDWRDYSTDRAKAAYDNFKPLDGKFNDNVILQIKNGPMDFQVREPVSPLFGGLRETNQVVELQITQEYTGQQRHLCYLVPQWKEILDFDTYAKGRGSYVKRIVDGWLFRRRHSGFTGVSNVGDNLNWTGNILAQANLYGYGRLAWDPNLTAAEIAAEWVKLTFGHDSLIVNTISEMLCTSWQIYENYTSPLGIGWMVNPNHHYGPNVDGYEYSKWGTYHRADHLAIGVDRSVKTGTGYAGQYYPENAEKFESPETCPEELLLFFHRIPYSYRLKSGKTVIQHIYDTHFIGVEQALGLKEKWESLKGRIDTRRYEQVLTRLEEQCEHAIEWRDVINTYFYRKTGIPDELSRKIYK